MPIDTADGSLRDRTVRGVSWSAAAQVGGQVLGILGTLALARLLAPQVFGLLGMVTVFTGLIAVFQNLGLGPAIIQDRTVDDEQLSGIFWLNLLFALALSAVSAAAAPLVSRFYGRPELLLVMVALSAVFPISALAMVPDALLTRDMDFRRLGIVNLAAQLLGLATGIGLAAAGFGVWALVWQQVAAALALAALKLRVARWTPRLALPARRIRPHLDFGVRLQAGSLLNYGTRNTDDLLIGRVFDAQALGVYQMAYRLMLWPLQNVAHVVGRVMFPALSAIQHDTPRVRHAFLQAVAVIAFITFPAMIGAWLVAPTAIPLVLGPRWAAVVPVFQILCLLGLIQSVATNTGWIFLSQGRADTRLRLQAFMTPLLILSFVVGLHWGIVGVAASYAVMSALLIPLQVRVAGRLIGMGVLDVARAVAGSLACALAMGVAVALAGWALRGVLGPWPGLAIRIAVGVVVYAVLVHTTRLPAYRELRAILAGRRPDAVTTAAP
ncbi:MAG: MOP flippase family protein [Gemmatimonadota bacterium]